MGKQKINLKDLKIGDLLIYPVIGKGIICSPSPEHKEFYFQDDKGYFVELGNADWECYSAVYRNGIKIN